LPASKSKLLEAARVDLGGAERQLRRSLWRVEVDRPANSGDDVAEGFVRAVGHPHSDVISGSLYVTAIPEWACLNGDIAGPTDRPNSGAK